MARGQKSSWGTIKKHGRDLHKDRQLYPGGTGRRYWKGGELRMYVTKHPAWAKKKWGKKRDDGVYFA